MSAQIQQIQTEIRRIYLYCKTNCGNLERWPSYYERRFLEFLSYLALMPNKKFDNILELGCGIGYQSAFLAQIANRVIATDLPDEDAEAHAPGMQQAKLLHQQLNINNVELIACSAEKLPFEDNSFDLVYSSHVLEHIPDWESALIEINRVLKPGGIHFCVVPTRAEKVYAFFNFYLYLLQRVIAKLFSLLKRNKSNSSNAIDTSKTTVVKSVLKDFPFPPPHGHSNHYLDELKNWNFSGWRKRITKNKIQHSIIIERTTQWNPLLSILGAIVPVLGTKIHGLTRILELQLGKFGLFKMIGLNAVFLIKKNQTNGNN